MARTLAFWFRKVYRLAPTDPRFLDCTLEQIETEYWAYHYDANPSGEEVEDEEFDKDAELDRIRREAEERDGGDADDWETVVDHNSDKA